ncbi:MAG: radical SAM protein [Alphaproteobacteria bacterium]|nr:radical SAM protein [Alphaproteobacteria bacterium]
MTSPDNPLPETATAARKAAPYVFYGQTTSLCSVCLALVPAKIAIEGDDVFYLKRCPDHGVQKVKVSSDAAYWRSTKEYIKPGDRPLTCQTKTHYGCPLDCGLCPDHEQHSCLALIEINQKCNLSCPVCFAVSSPEKDGTLTLEQVEAMMDTLVKSEGQPDVLQISGGEPTIHPQFFEILAAAKKRPIRHLMVNTNGVRLAGEKGFAEKLKEFCPGFEVYLQFDSLKKDALLDLRGVDLRSTRRAALDALEAAGVPVTLVVTVKRGVNDDEVGAILEHALEYKCVRGVTYQPVQDAGRNEGFDEKRDRILLSDVRRAIYEQSDVFKPEDIIPLPCNPASISIAYGLREGKKVVPVTSLFPREELVSALPNAVTFEQNPALKEKVIDLFSLSTNECNTAERMEALLCCLPEVPVAKGLGYENVFRVTVVSFMDRHNFCIADVKRSCIHFVTPEGSIIPFETYNMFYRDGLVHELRRNGRIGTAK